MMSEWSLVLGVLGAGMIILTSMWKFSTWISEQFSSMKDYVNDRISDLENKVIDKIDYHERLDNNRFSNIHNEIWELKVLDATRNGAMLKNAKTKEDQSPFS